MKLFEVLSIQQNLYQSYNYIGKAPKNRSKVFRLLLLNESFFYSYLQTILWINQVIKHPTTIVFLDSRNLHQRILSIKFSFIAKLVNLYTGFISNKVIISKYQVKRKKEKLKVLPQIIVIFDLDVHLSLIKEASKLQIPLICFFNKQVTYNNLYRLTSNSSLRTYILFVAILAILYFKSLLISINYKNIKI